MPERLCSIPFSARSEVYREAGLGVIKNLLTDSISAEDAIRIMDQAFRGDQLAQLCGTEIYLERDSTQVGQLVALIENLVGHVPRERIVSNAFLRFNLLPCLKSE